MRSDNSSISEFNRARNTLACATSDSSAADTAIMKRPARKVSHPPCARRAEEQNHAPCDRRNEHEQTQQRPQRHQPISTDTSPTTASPHERSVVLPLRFSSVNTAPHLPIVQQETTIRNRPPRSPHTGDGCAEPGCDPHAISHPETMSTVPSS
ncbi:Uncharacterised protein [Mycobacteroides abscessus subsp. abscessus]|nr:Uncharacterised protein [Mycobacteroides abscessus subsp. abscessus]